MASSGLNGYIMMFPLPVRNEGICVMSPLLPEEFLTVYLLLSVADIHLLSLEGFRVERIHVPTC